MRREKAKTASQTIDIVPGDKDNERIVKTSIDLREKSSYARPNSMASPMRQGNLPFYHRSRTPVLGFGSFLMPPFLIALSLVFHPGGISQAFEAPQVPGLKITVGETIPIPWAVGAVVHRMPDGRLVLPADGKESVWSSDGGLTWEKGPRGPSDKTVINLSNGDIVSLSRTSIKRSEGKYRLRSTRSSDGWKTTEVVDAILDTPLATATGGDAGDRLDGLLMHHGILELESGRLLATLYGNYQGDNLLALGYPVEFNFRKYRTLVVSSTDEGRTWGDPVTVAYDRQLARGNDPDSSVHTTTVVPAVTQEGFCEADLERASNGDLLCVMRSGGRIGIPGVPIYPTPLYLSRSTDEGDTWTSPIPIADRGVCPYLNVLDNGVLVCAYARPGSWLIFSDDDGETWKGAFEIGPSDSYCNAIEVAPNKILALYRGEADESAEVHSRLVGTFFTVERK